MTAEIAIINRSAVTLATDSAVTLKVRGHEKVYNSADKLFELSTIDPIGLMIYNNLEFMGIGIEVAAKNFREKIALKKHYTSVQQAADDFFKYLTDHENGTLETQNGHIKSLIYPTLERINENWFNASAVEFVEKHQNTDFDGLLTAAINDELSYLRALPPAESLSNITSKNCLTQYKATFEWAIKQALKRAGPLLDGAKMKALRQICSLSLLKDTYSGTSTGMVFAGFGQGDDFPSLIAYQLDGIVCGVLKKKETDRVITDRSKITGEILPFAQREMVDRFLYGIDPEFERGIEDYLLKSIKGACEGLIDSLSERSVNARKKLTRGIGPACDRALKDFREEMICTVKDRFMGQVQDMVFLMPKQELATLAEELINITSVKRKFSRGKETVGGPIDVAVISRIDGFVWVRRKHYFTKELNPRYYVRRFGADSQGV